MHPDGVRCAGRRALTGIGAWRCRALLVLLSLRGRAGRGLRVALRAWRVQMPLRGRAGPGRRPGNFHLLAQMKVTKAKGLENTSGLTLASKELTT